MTQDCQVWRRPAELEPADVGWLLANAREHAADRTLRSAAGFARSGPSGPVHRSQVGRWESGHTPAGHLVVRRYEETLGLPRGHLGLAVDFMARRLDPLRIRPALPRPGSDTWAEDGLTLVERALSPEPMSGVDWDDLTAILAAHPEVLLRGADWEHLLFRVSLEAATHSGPEYSFRAEAGPRLAGHPRSGPHLVRLAQQALDDPTTQLFETVALLQYSTEPAAAELLTHHLERPSVRESVAWTALFTLTSMARAGRLDRATRTRAGTRALQLLRDPDRSIRLHRTAAAFIDAIDPPTRSQIVSALNAESRRRIARIVNEGAAFSAAEIAEAGRRVEGRLADLLGPTSRWAPQLHDLVRTATASSHLESRGLALEVLLLLPQGRGVGLVYADELRDHLAQQDVVRADDALARLSWLAQPEDASYLLSVALDPELDPVTAAQAAVATANARYPVTAGTHAGQAVVTVDEELVQRAFAGTEQLLRQRVAASVSTPDPARGHLYLLGMAGRFDLLGRLDSAAREASLTDWRQALRWWLDLPEWARPRRGDPRRWGGAPGLPVLREPAR